MSFLDFYSNHYISFTFVMSSLIGLTCFGLVKFFKKLDKKHLKTPWFEIASESVNDEESEDMGKTRLLINRQIIYVNNYVKGLQPIFLSVTKLMLEDAMKNIFSNEQPPKTHMMTCLIQSETNALLETLKLYMNNLLVLNHIGSNKEKIESYAKGHTSQLFGITRQFYCDMYTKLSGEICVDTLKYWKQINIEPSEWVYKKLYELLIGITELRYSDFNKENIQK